MSSYSKLVAIARNRLAAVKQALESLDTSAYAPDWPARGHAAAFAGRAGSMEEAYCAKRRVIASAALGKLLGENVHPEHIPTIGIALSGGGSRAMISSLASITALQNAGIFDTVTYIAAVSGSTWSLSQIYKPSFSTIVHTSDPVIYTSEENPLLKTTVTTTVRTKTSTLSSATSPKDALNSARVFLAKNILNPVPLIDSPPKVAVATALERLKVNRYSMNLVDIFGVLLTAAFLEPSPMVPPEMCSDIPRISDQIAIVNEGYMPLPIYCAVSRNSVGLLYPTSPSVFGSAFTANLHRILEEIESDLPAAPVQAIKSLLKEKIDTTHAVAPSRFPNPFYQMATNANFFDTNSPSIDLMDAGMDNSIPFAPLLLDRRNVDVLIVCDASADIGIHPFLKRADDYAKRRGIHLGMVQAGERRAKQRNEDSRTSAYEIRNETDTSGSGPQVIYLPLQGEAATAWYAKAANFAWTEQQVDSIAQLASSQAKEAETEIVTAMSDTKISVVVRVRPISEDLCPAADSAWLVSENSITLKDKNPLSFSFDAIFGPSAQTKDIYTYSAKDIISSCCEGINGTIFAYGQTSSGKTFTMSGDRGTPGVILLAIEDIFGHIQSMTSLTYSVKVVNDLISPENSNLKIHEHMTRGVHVGNLTEVSVSSPEEVKLVISKGEVGKRTTIDAAFACLAWYLLVSHFGSNSKTQNLVDLAGSERAAHTGAEGKRLKEGGSINKSLLALATVIGKLSEEGVDGVNRHIPYRNSKITRILQPSLGGNARTLIICTVTPSMGYIDETISTLKFASRAKTIRNKPVVNEVVRDDVLIKQYREEISLLKTQLNLVKNDMFLAVFH
ncbi:hypothetical protein HDU84_006868 [Entophlyctis sp. JEL0112]|nr:hypothetical protein HDU84_006868 [Entophlyctis sp. JEL0112]